MKLVCVIYCVLLMTGLLPVLSKQFGPKIGIVGGGIGGTSCAYFLRKVFQDKAQLTLYERDIIGGRLNSLNIDGNYYESGGAVIHPRNQYMVQFSNLLGLDIKKPSSSKLGIYDGQHFVFRESDWHLITMIHFLWRYGFSLYGLKKQVKSMLDDFSKIYAAQDQGLAFTTVNGILDYMNPTFRNMTQQTLSKYLEKKGYTGLVVDELVQSIMMVNYGQTNNITAFAGFVSLAGADDHLFSIKGGNKLVAEGLLEQSKASVINGDVIEITLLSDGTYSLKYNDTSGKGNVKLTNHDIIILAAPFISGTKNIKFKNFKKSFDAYQVEFHQTVSTFVEGILNSSAFNSDSTPGEILTFKNTLLFNSLSKVKPVDGKSPKKDVYKIFSQQPLSSSTINNFFENTGVIKDKDWLAYPHYKASEEIPPFMLYSGLYYINAIELSASAMEMSSIASKNVALLAYNTWNNLISLIDQHTRIYRDEL